MIHFVGHVVKTFLSIILGLVLATSMLVGIAYTTTIIPVQYPGGPPYLCWCPLFGSGSAGNPSTTVWTIQLRHLPPVWFLC